MSDEIKNVSAISPCSAMGGFHSFRVSADIKDDLIVHLHCPLRSEDAPCLHVDVRRLPCCLIPQHDLSDDAIYTEE